MSLSFCSLGSGSKGNGTLVYDGDPSAMADSGTLLLVDCGFTLKETEKRLQRLTISPHRLDAIIVTHEHGDHINGVGPLARKYGIPVYITAGTLYSKDMGKLDDVREIKHYRPFAINALQVTPVAVPHDAREPAQYIIESKRKRLGILTDLGSISPHVEMHYQSCDALVLEANHDAQMLAAGPYPPSLKQRVGGAWGHLNNQQAARFLENVDRDKLEYVVIAHISQQNNTVELARGALAEVLAPVENVIYACQDQGFGWVRLN